MSRSDPESDIENRFIIKRARFKLTWKPERWLTARLQVGDFDRMEFGRSLLRDAYVHLSPFRLIEVRVGQFKKPFSGLAMRSSGKLRVAERGEGHELIVEDLLYGERDLGVQLSGRLVRSIKLDYEIGLFNGTGIDSDEIGNAKDVVARFKVEPSDWLDLGASGSLKFFDDEIHRQRDERHAWAAGADAVVKWRELRLHLEGTLARDHLYAARYLHLHREVPWPEMPLMVSVVGILSYRHTFDASYKVAVEPVFKMEVLDPHTDFIEDHVLVYGPGFNAYFGKRLRLMLHTEIRRGGAARLSSFEDRELLMLQLCLDI